MSLKRSMATRAPFFLKLGLSAMALTALAIGLGALTGKAQATSPVGGQPGVLLELFTSQGCYSCPPADDVLGELAKREDVVGLSLNVDYWDRLGWKDTMAKRAYTLRQYGYAYAMRETGVYTPQLVIQGAADVVGSDRLSVRRALRAAASDHSYTLDLRRKGDVVTVAIRHAGTDEGAVLMAAPYRKAATQKIDRGENGGKTLTYYNVALDLQEIGRVPSGQSTFTVEALEKADGVAVWVQKTTRRGPFGAVLAASKLEF